MKKLLMCVIGTTMLTSVAVAEICTDFDDDFNLIEYECGTSIKDAKKVESAGVKSESKTTGTTTRKRGSNVMDGNPLYIPTENHGYSITTLGYGTKELELYGLFDSYKMSMYGINEEFGFGITDRFTLFGGVDTAFAEINEQNYGVLYEFYQNQADIFVGGIYRLIDHDSWKMDMLGQYRVNGAYSKLESDYNYSWEKFFDAEFTDYVWSFGLRGGYISPRFTLAGHTYFYYENTKSFNWDAIKGKQGKHSILIGLDGQFVLNRFINVVAGVDYSTRLDTTDRGDTDIQIETPDILVGTVGLNVNVNKNTFVGLYAKGYLNTPFDYVEKSANTGSVIYSEETKENFEAGLKIGVDF